MFYTWLCVWALLATKLDTCRKQRRKEDNYEKKFKENYGY